MTKRELFIDTIMLICFVLFFALVVLFNAKHPVGDKPVQPDQQQIEQRNDPDGTDPIP